MKARAAATSAYVLQKRNELELAVNEAHLVLNRANAALAAFLELAENNVYATMAAAHAEIEDALYARASDDCEGSYNVGHPEYRQHFMVDGVEYVMRGLFEYHHDKKDYYIDEHSYKVEQVAK